jgi:hypothetical protein
MIPNEQDRQRLVAAAKKIPGIEEVHVGVGLLPDV